MNLVLKFLATAILFWNSFPNLIAETKPEKNLTNGSWIELVEDWEFFPNAYLIRQIREGVENEPSLHCKIQISPKWEKNSFCKDVEVSPFLTSLLSSNPQGQIIQAPHSWESHRTSQGEPIPKEGTALYKKTIYYDQSHVSIYARNWLTSSASRVWIRKGASLELLGKSGSPGLEPKFSRQMWSGVLFDLDDYESPVELWLEVSNFHYRTGVLGDQLILGETRKIHTMENFYKLTEVSTFGILFMTGIYHSILYLYKRSLLYSLLFGINCIIIAFRTLLIGRIPNLIFPENEWFPVLMKLEYMTMTFPIFLFYYYMNVLIERKQNRFFDKMIQGVSLFLTLLILFTPMNFYTKLILYIYLLIVVFAVSILIILVHGSLYSPLPSIKSKNRSILVGFLILSVFMINDVVIYSLGIRGLDLAEIGLVIFTINQSVLIAKYNAEQWTTAEKLTKDLDQLVIERTHDLKIANAQIEESKKATEELNLLLQSLNESMDIESMLDKINHFISKKYSFENYALYKVNPNRNFIQLVAHNLKNSLTQDIIDQIETNPIPIKNARGAHALCYKSRKPHHLNRMRIKGLPEEEKLVINQLEFKSFFMIPLILNNQCIGFLDFSSKLEFGIHKEDLSLYSILGKQLSGILYNAQLFREVEGQRNAKENALLELKETQTALSRAERSASINSMISHLAHEVNNPLNFISTAEMVIQESYKELKDFILGAIPDSEETRNFREKIQKLFEEMESGYKQSKTGTVRIRDTIAEIRAITGVDGLHVENFDAYPLLIQNLELTLEKNQIPESSIQIYINGKPWKESHPIQVTHLSQKYIFSRSIRTLLNNALIFASKSDAPSVHIGISIQNLTNRKFTILSIKSNGMKIDSELLPKLFDLKSQLYYGTEIIGLPIIKELLKTVQSNITLVDDGRKSGWVEFQILLMDNL